MHFEICRDLCRKINTLLFDEKYFYATKTEECGKYQNKLLKLTKYLMESNSNVNLPYSTSAELLADNFFHDENNNHQEIRSFLISKIILVISPWMQILCLMGNCSKCFDHLLEMKSRI